MISDKLHALATSVIGKTLEEAMVAIDNENCQIRLVQHDKRLFVVANDYREDRINVNVQNGRITKAKAG